MKVKIPYLQWRDGRPRWEPGPALRKRGLKGRDLKDGDGNWLPLGDAMKAAEALNRDAVSGRQAAPATPAATNTLGEAWLALTRTPEFRKLRDKTRRDYETKARVFIAWAGDAPVASLRRSAIKAYWRVLHDQRGHAMANGVITVLRLTLEHAIEMEWIAANPATKLKLLEVPPRVVVFTAAECAALVDAADRLGEHGIGDAIVIALHTAQRQGDILSMEEGLIEGGMVKLRQAKTGALVEFPATQILQQRLELAVRRARARTNVRLLNWRPLVVDDRTGEPFNEHTFRHRFADVRAAAAEAEPGIADKRFQDLRDTALTRLYQAGLSLLRIASISGHQIRTVDQVLRHYIALNADDGAAAIEAYEGWLERQGVRV